MRLFREARETEVSVSLSLRHLFRTGADRTGKDEEEICVNIINSPLPVSKHEIERKRLAEAKEREVRALELLFA